MSFRSRRPGGLARVILVTVAVILPLASAFAGVFQQGVGGISIDPSGHVRNARVDKGLLERIQKELDAAAPEMNAPVGMRKISLRQLEAAIQDALTNDMGQLPEEILYLAGLQRIEYVLVYPEQNDIVLAGPGEGWRVDEQANVVGITTGRPVMRLDDLLVALRTVQQAHDVGISCSIDPTPEGLQRLQAVLNRARGNNINPAQLEPAMLEAIGPQTITLKGVPATSHAARVMVAADYHMKRLAMNIDPSPVAGLPSYIDLAKNSSEVGSANPRWWMACNYETLAKSEDGLAWQLRGQGVKTLTEDNLFLEDGRVENRKGKTSPLAQKWADLMTEKYDDLSGKNAVFGELRNFIDMCVVAAIIEKNDLRTLANCQLPLLYDTTSDLAIESWTAPKTVAPVCSFTRTRKGWVATASGGVQIESWEIADQTSVQPELADIRLQVRAAEPPAWWWN